MPRRPTCHVGAVLLGVHSLKVLAGREELATCELELLDGFWSPHRYWGFGKLVSS